MEWVETTGKTVEEALELALEQLGVDVADAEYEVVEEAKTGLFGRLRSEARVRARVRPTTPRPKEERRGRGRKTSGGRSEARSTTPPTTDASRASKPAAEATERAPRRNPNQAAAVPTMADERPSRPPRTPRTKEDPVSDTDAPVIPLSEQGEVAAAFVRGVVERFGTPDASVSTHELDADTLEVRVEGEDLGLLIGPKGAALQSLQELTRTVVQRQTGARSGRILVDVSGYRARRKEALERFAHKIAEDVLASGTRVVLEPMNPSDRKVIHDTINDIDGVSTSSEGEEPRRRVVVSPV
jgi:spoIIIJ-associated protein